jgi:hypothetical protein
MKSMISRGYTFLLINIDGLFVDGFISVTACKTDFNTNKVQCDTRTLDELNTAAFSSTENRSVGNRSKFTLGKSASVRNEKKVFVIREHGVDEIRQMLKTTRFFPHGFYSLLLHVRL